LCLLFVATLEVCTRVEAWWRWGAPFWGAYSSEILLVTDEVGTRNRPGARFEKWVVNGAGFRGPEVSVEKAPGVVRVGVAGASEVFGLYESPEKDLTAQLGARLAQAAPGRFEVVNLASAGMSPPRIRELFERWAGRFAFDVVVVYPTPAFYLDVEPPERTLGPARVPRGPDARRFSLRLPDKLWRALRERLPAALQAWLKRVEIERARRAHSPEWVWRVPPRDRVELFAADMRELVSAIRQAGARPILATHAHRFTLPLRGAESHQMDGWVRFYPRATAECLIDMERQANSVLLEIGRDQGIGVADVQEAVGKDPRHYADFSHFTDEGAGRAAQALARAILAQDR
jgi:hypothetical protein